MLSLWKQGALAEQVVRVDVEPPEIHPELVVCGVPCTLVQMLSANVVMVNVPPEHVTFTHVGVSELSAQVFKG